MALLLRGSPPNAPDEEISQTVILEEEMSVQLERQRGARMPCLQHMMSQE